MVVLLLICYLSLAVFYELGFDSNLAVILHAATVVPIALLFVRRVVTVKKTTTDHVYYSLGAIAVALVFIYETPDRERLDLLTQIRLTRIAIDEQEVLHRYLSDEIALRERLNKRTNISEGIVLEAVRKGAVEAQKRAREVATEICQQYTETMLQERLKIPPFNRGDRTMEPDVHLNSSEALGIACRTATEHAQHPAWAEFSSILSFKDFKRVADKIRPNANIRISFHLDGTSYTLSQLYDVLFVPDSNTKLQEKLEESSERRDLRRRELEDQEKKLDTVSESTRFTWADEMVGKAVAFGWPFLLISLLGLKLSRPD